MPPSTLKSLPYNMLTYQLQVMFDRLCRRTVMKEESSEARNKAALAISIASPNRPANTVSFTQMKLGWGTTHPSECEPSGDLASLAC